MPLRPLTEDQRRQFETDMAGSALETCEAIMRKLGELPDGVLLSLSAKGARIEPVPIPPDIRIRTAVAETCRKMLLGDQATAYAFGLEVWSRQGTKEDLKKPAGNDGEMPDRFESVLIVGQTKDGNFGAAYDIVRAVDGRFDRLKARDNASGRIVFSGIWTDLLYRPQAS